MTQTYVDAAYIKKTLDIFNDGNIRW
jgi:hypothetical protein